MTTAQWMHANPDHAHRLAWEVVDANHGDLAAALGDYAAGPDDRVPPEWRTPVRVLRAAVREQVGYEADERQWAAGAA